MAWRETVEVLALLHAPQVYATDDRNLPENIDGIQPRGYTPHNGEHCSVCSKYGDRKLRVRSCTGWKADKEHNLLIRLEEVDPQIAPVGGDGFIYTPS